MPDVLEQVHAFIERHRMLEGTRGVVVAVSGGPDSVSLLDLLARLITRPERIRGADPAWRSNPPFLHVAHLDHGLRGEESAEDARFVGELAQALGLGATVGSVDVRAAAQSRGGGIEETARHLRYQFLLSTALKVGAGSIAVGHTMDDQAETFLMRLARGAGTRGLAGMRPLAPVPVRLETQGPVVSLIRPLLCLTREEVASYCRERQLPFRTDRTNLSLNYTRNRIRHRVIPALREINPMAVRAIGRAADLCADDQEVLRELAAAAAEKARVADGRASGSAYSVEALITQAPALRRRALVEAIEFERGGQVQLNWAHVAAVAQLLGAGMSGKQVVLPGGLRVWREFDLLVFERGGSPAATPVSELSLEHPSAEAGGFRFTLRRGLPPSAMTRLREEAGEAKSAGQRDWMFVGLDERALPQRLLIRPRLPGERAQVLGHRRPKKLKNLMIDHRIPSSRRTTWPVVVTPGGEYVWAPGLPPATQFAGSARSSGLAVLRAYAL